MAESVSKSDRTRGRILDAAAGVLSRKGYAGMRMVDVAKAAGIQAPAIYYHFSSRDDLVEAVIWEGAHRVRVHLEAVLAELPDHVSARDRLLAAVEAHLRCELEFSDYTIAAVRNAGQLPERVRERPAAEQSAYSRLWQTLFRAAADAGELRADVDINVFRLLLLGSMNWAVEWWNPRTRTIEDLIASTQDLVRYSTFVPD